jgi:hypothetical protein
LNITVRGSGARYHNIRVAFMGHVNKILEEKKCFLMYNYLLLIPLLIIVIYILHRSKAFPKVVKFIGYGYYFVLTLVFIIVKERISFIYKGSPDLDIYWEKNSNWADIALFLYLVPAALILFMVVFYRFKKEKDFKRKLLMLLFLVVGLGLLFVYAFCFSMAFGYSP